MAIANFFKKLLGSGDAPAPKPAAAPPQQAAPAAIDPDRLIDDCRKAVRRLDKRADPAAWANAQEILANNLIYAASLPAHDAPQMLGEAAAILGEAIDALGPSADPARLGALHKLRGNTLYNRSLLVFGDDKGQALADAANAFAAAIAVCPREAGYQIWCDSGFFRGAALQELAALKSGPQALAWLDEAAAVFADIARNGAADGSPHPIAAYNAYVVFEGRARRTDRAEARHFYEQAKRQLINARSASMFASNPAEHTRLLAALDATIADL